MGSEAQQEAEESSSPKLSFFSLPHLKSLPDQSTMATPPHHAASVPFRWEETPGKPRLCKPPSPAAGKGLELPPRLLFESKFPKTPSPTTVLEGPYVGRSLFHSLRFIGGGAESGGGSPERSLLGPPARGRMMGSWRKTVRLSFRKGEREVADEGSFIFSGFSDDGEKLPAVAIKGVGRKRSQLGLTKARSNFWASIYGAMKQAIPCTGKSSVAKGRKC